jgi:hypothetical protein
VEALELLLERPELLVDTFFQVHEPRPGSTDRTDELVELQLDGESIAVLRVLDEKDREERQHRGALGDSPPSFLRVSRLHRS